MKATLLLFPVFYLSVENNLIDLVLLVGVKSTSFIHFCKEFTQKYKLKDKKCHKDESLKSFVLYALIHACPPVLALINRASGKLENYSKK